jgi:tetratricopeptide (TPR) repeat protein
MQTPDRANAYYHFMLAHQYEEMATTFGRSEYATKAIEEYKMALNDDPTSRYLNGHLAELYFNTGHIKEAIEAAQQEVKRDPSDLEAHRLLAQVYLRALSDQEQQDLSKEMLNLAIGQYQKIVSLAPKSVEDRLMLARLYAASGDSAKAESEITAAQSIDPGSARTALIANRFYLDAGNTQKAIEVLASLPDDDQTATTEYQLGVTYDQAKDTANAVKAFRKALSLGPDNPDVERSLARDLTSAGQTDEALAAWQDIAAGDPTSTEAWGHIADIQEQKGNLPEALKAVQKARELSSDDPQYDFREAMIDDALGNLDDAARLLNQLATSLYQANGQYSKRQKGNYALVLDRLAAVYREESRTSDAIAQYQMMATLGGDIQEQAYDEQVETYREAHQYDKAVATAREAVAKMPKSVDAKLTLARQLADTGHAEEGIGMVQDLLKAHPKKLTVYYQLAQIYADLRKWKDASKVLDQAEKLATTKGDQLMVLFQRAMMADRARHYSEAEKGFQKVLTMDPNNALTLNNYGFMLADRGVDLDKALSMIQKAVKLEPTNYAYLDSLGWAYYRLGDYAKAESNLRNALSRGANDPTVHDHLGDVYEKTGQLKLAATQWELSLNEYAHTVQADMDAGAMSRVQKKLDSARVRLAKETGKPRDGK